MKTPFVTFRAVLCLATAVMMAISWPLWVSGGVFPKVPFVGGLRPLPIGASWVRFGISIAALVVGASGFRWRTAFAVAIGLSAWMVLEDQHRLQPWMYQFLLMGFALAASSEAQGLWLGRIVLIALYFHSGLSKLDVAFVQGLGQTFITTWAGLVGNSPANWPPAVRTASILSMPILEILLAIGLAFRPTRRMAVICAVLQHSLLLAILGPWGLRHSANVLLWNVAIAVEVVILFGWAGSADPAREAPILHDAGGLAGVPRETTPMSSFARSLIVLAAVLPFGERAGFWDAWPSFALYSGHDERTDFVVSGDDLPAFPQEIRRHFHSVGNREVLSFNEWSLAERRAPAYPQARALNGVAEALAARYRGRWPAQLIQHGRAEPLTGRRDNHAMFGLEAIRRHGDSSFVNAHPAP